MYKNEHTYILKEILGDRPVIKMSRTVKKYIICLYPVIYICDYVKYKMFYTLCLQHLIKISQLLLISSKAKIKTLEFFDAKTSVFLIDRLM